MMSVFRSKRLSFQSTTAWFLFGLCCLAVLLSAGPAVAMTTPAPIPASTTYYVRTNVQGTGDGLSWANASSDLAGVLNDAVVSGDEIWVAEGTYRPTTDSTDRFASFELQSGVALYGGFPATGSPDSGDREPGTYITVLTGDIDSNDIVDQYGIVVSADYINGSNSYHVVYADSVDENAVLDGFVVTAGKADNTDFPKNYGGGMLNINSSSQVTNCTFSGNWAYGGGGIGNYNSRPTVTNCTFRGNTGYNYGGGIFNSGTQSMVTNCTFSVNEAGMYGGGMSNRFASTATVTNCTFSGNWDGGSGDGLYNNGSHLAVTNCIFWAEGGESFGDSFTLSYCLVQSGDVAVLYETNDNPVTSGNIALQPLADNGGPTWTCALGTGSSAIDAGVTLDTLSTDQRGAARPYPSGGSFDIGAYEWAGSYTVTVSADVGGAVSVDPYGIIISGDVAKVSKDFQGFSSPTFVITPEESMDLTGVWLDSKDVSFDVTGATVTLEPLSAKHTLEATFAVRTFNVTTSAGSGGSVFPSGTTSVIWGDDLDVDITPCHGYAVSDVVVGSTSQGAVTSYTLNNIRADQTLHVTFTADQALLSQGGLESLNFPDTGGAMDSLMGGTASVDLPAELSCDDFSPVSSADLGGFWLETVDSDDFETEALSAEPGGTFLCGTSFDVVASEGAGVGLLAMDLELVVPEDNLSTGCLESIETGEAEAGLTESFLTSVAILKVFSDDAYDLFDVALDSGADPLDFFTVSRDSGSFLVGVGLLIADAAAEGVDAVQAVPASSDCRFLIFDGAADGHFRDPLVAVEKDSSSGGDSGCNALSVSGLALLMLPLLGLLKKR